MKAWTACALGLSLLLVHSAQAERNPGKSTLRTQTGVKPVVHIALHRQGILVGQVVDRQGVGRKGEVVVIKSRRQIVASVKTQANGRFMIRGLRSGLHQIESRSSVASVQFWAAQAAPPAAKSAVILLADDKITQATEVVRGQGSEITIGPAQILGGAAIIGAVFWASDNNEPGS